MGFESETHRAVVARLRPQAAPGVTSRHAFPCWSRKPGCASLTRATGG